MTKTPNAEQLLEYRANLWAILPDNVKDQLLSVAWQIVQENPDWAERPEGFLIGRFASKGITKNEVPTKDVVDYYKLALQEAAAL